jgi:hypothetical protein
VRRIFDVLAGTILLGGLLAFVIAFITETYVPRPCELHMYTVVRINPALDPLIIPTLSGGHNPRLILTEMMACGYEHVGDGKTVFYTNELRDTITDVVHVQDKGPIR